MLVQPPDASVSGFDPGSSLTSQLDEARLTHPGLAVTVELPQHDHLDAVLASGRTSELLIAPTEQDDDRWSIRTGLLASRLIRLSPCPVMLVGRLSLCETAAA